MVGSALAKIMAAPRSEIGTELLRAAPWLLVLWLLSVGGLIVWRAWPRAPELPLRRLRRAAAVVGLGLLVSAGVVAGALAVQPRAGSAPALTPPVPGTTVPAAPAAPPVQDRQYERVVPLISSEPRRISC